MDTVSRKTRSYIMSRVKGKNTGPEVAIRKKLHNRGFRYRLHVKKLPGTPDLVFPKYNAIIFINGCYWHSHGCYMATIPKTRTGFWTEKFEKNKERDANNWKGLQKLGWRLLIVWECGIKGKYKRPTDSIVDEIAIWLNSQSKFMEIHG